MVHEFWKFDDDFFEVIANGKKIQKLIIIIM